MAPYSTADGEELDTELTPEDVVGHVVYNTTRHIGLGMVEEIVPNGYRDGSDAFKCRPAAGQDDKTVRRRIDTIMRHLTHLDYELCDESLEPVENPRSGGE